MTKRRKERLGESKVSLEVNCDVLDCESKTHMSKVRSDGWHSFRSESRYGVFRATICPEHITLNLSDELLAEGIALGLKKLAEEAE